MIKEKCFVSAVVYIHNNQNEVDTFFDGLCDQLDNNFEQYEIICVDDHSSDDSVKILKQKMKNKRCTVKLVSMGYYQGIEPSMNAGIDATIGDVVFEFDCMCSDYSFSTIMDIYRKQQEGYDIVGATPKELKRWTSSLFYKMLALNNRNSKKLRTETFRIVSRRAINRVHDMNITVPYRQVAYMNCGLKYEIMEYNVVNKVKPNLNGMYRRNLALDSVVFFTNIGFSFSVIMCLCFLIHGLVSICKNKGREGVDALGTAGVFGTLALIIKYLDVIKTLVFRKQTYIVNNIEKLNNLSS